MIVAFGCTACNPVKPDDVCADRPIYKAYNIDLPARPKLTSGNQISEGDTVRAVEEDMSLLAEYAEKLENLLKSLPKNISVPQ